MSYRFTKKDIWAYFGLTEETKFVEATEEDILKLGAEIMRLNERILKLEARK